MKPVIDLKGRESGQTLILVALGLIALLAFVALAIDGGSAYAARRVQQNSADAGALAGAYELCFGTPGNAAARARTYATTLNGAETATVNVNMSAYTVHVVAHETVETFFAGAIGVPSIDISAEATAACGVANTSCGLFPISFDLTLWTDLAAQCGRTFMVWTDDNKDGPDCDVCDCDIDKSQPGNEVITNVQRAWLDFSTVMADPLYPGSCAKGGCGASELKCWIDSDNPAPIRLPSCIPGDTGVKAGTYKHVEDREGDIVRIPIFDSIGCASSANCAGDTYHVSSFGCVKIGDPAMLKNFQMYNLSDGGKCWKGTLMSVSVSCDPQCATACGSTTGGGPPPPGVVKAVSLTD